MILDDRMVDAVLAVSSCHLRFIKKKHGMKQGVFHITLNIISDLHVNNAQVLRKRNTYRIIIL